jgi:phosphate transport system ATP-binding protein
MTTKTPYPWQTIEEHEECCVPQTQINIKNLSLSYKDRQAFRQITMPIYKGCITSIVGPSGCGKSSFLMTLNRLSDLIEDCYVTGDISLDGADIRDPKVDLKVLRRKIGMIFQKPNPFPLSIRKNLEFPLREHGVTDKKILEERIEDALTKTGLWNEVKDRLDTPALALSGGQQQRLCIARAVCLQPEILLMDEPCSALDPISSATIETLINNLKGKYTIVIVTHNLAQARRISDHSAFFWFNDGAGELIEFAKTRNLFESPGHELTAAYVGGMKG